MKSVRSLSLLTLSVLAVSVVLQPLYAVILPPASVVPISGTSVAAQPSLGGVVLADRVVPISITYPNVQGKKVIWRGQLQSRVVRGADNRLDFYYRVMSDPTNTINVSGVAVFTSPDAIPYLSNNLDVDWRKDGIGAVGPNSVTNGGASLVFSFAPGGVAPGQSSRFFYVRTNAVRFALNDSLRFWGGSESTLVYGPAK